MISKGEQGSFYILSAMICTILAILSCMLISNISSEYLKCKQMEERLIAFNLAEAGIEKAIWKLKKDGSNYKGEEDTHLGRGIFSVKLEEKDDRIFITSIGYFFNQKKPGIREKIKVVIRKEDLKIELWEQG